MNQDGYWANGPQELEWIHEQAQETGVGFAMFPLSSNPNDMDAPLAAVFYMPPHFVLPRHAHACHRVEVVVEGSVLTNEGSLQPGDVSVSGPGEFYGPHTAGPEGSVTVEIFSTGRAVDGIYENSTPPQQANP
jgi:hypothetical protein